MQVGQLDLGYCRWPFFCATGRCDSGGSGAGAFLLAESSTSCSILTRDVVDVVDVDWGSSLGAF